MDRTIQQTAKYACAVGQVVREAKKQSNRTIAFVDVHGAIEDLVAGNREVGLQEYLSDGLHLTGEGYKVSLLRSWLGFILILFR